MENNNLPEDKKKSSILLLALIVLLVLAIGYIVYDKLIASDTKEKLVEETEIIISENAKTEMMNIVNMCKV